MNSHEIFLIMSFIGFVRYTLLEHLTNCVVTLLTLYNISKFTFYSKILKTLKLVTLGKKLKFAG